MNNESLTLSKYRLEKAKEDLESAYLNLQNNLLKASINRSYYCIFHGVRAINALHSFDSKKHSGVISYFNQHFIHTGEFDKEVYSIISTAYRIRERSDYDDFYIVSREDAQNQYEKARCFFILVDDYIKKVLE
ncbi:MAG: HEPN domain-containing protein [Tissierellaceae bacterium]